MSQVTLKLVGASRYISPLIGPDVVEKNQTFTVSRENADKLLQDKKFDALNNEHVIFTEMGAEVATPEDEEEGDDKAKSKPAARAPRSKKAA